MEAALQQGHFPTLAIMSKYGLTGADGSNPIYVFERYRRGITEGHFTFAELEDAMEQNRIKEFVDSRCKQ